MIRRSRQLRLSATAGVAGNDTDALQTDVMRFMSIIGLCLMAVFALVQGLPVQDQGKAAAVAQSSRLREVVRTQQLQLEQLQDRRSPIRWTTRCSSYVHSGNGSAPNLHRSRMHWYRPASRWLQRRLARICRPSSWLN